VDLDGLDGELAPWRRWREERAWARIQLLEGQAAELLHEAHVERERTRRKLGDLGVHANERIRQLEARARTRQASADWYRRCRMKVRTFRERRMECGEQSIQAFCGHCGVKVTFPKACGAHQACGDCARARARRVFRKLVPAIERTLKREEDAWRAAGCPDGGRPIVSMLTITMRSSSLLDLGERRKLFSEAWNRFRSWYQAAYKQRLQYAWTVECTEGQNNQGHVHAHAVVVMPYVEYKTLSKRWDECTQGVGGHIQGPGKHHRGGRKRGTPAQAAWYVAKYVSKGVKFAQVQVGAAWVRAQHGKRGVSTSRGWWWTDLRTEHRAWFGFSLQLKPIDDTLDMLDAAQVRRVAFPLEVARGGTGGGGGPGTD